MLLAPAGVALIVLAKPLSRSSLFYYLSAAVFGLVFMSMFLARPLLSPSQNPAAAGGSNAIGEVARPGATAAVAGVTTGLVSFAVLANPTLFTSLLHEIWRNTYVFWTCLAVAITSVAITFWMGPPDQHTKTTLRVALTVIGAVVIYIDLHSDKTHGLLPTTIIVGLLLMAQYAWLPLPISRVQPMWMRQHRIGENSHEAGGPTSPTSDVDDAPAESARLLLTDAAYEATPSR